MKELTIEQKAKAYDDALERARNLHKDAIDMGENTRVKQCEIIFPELADSNDDRIRKSLITYFQKFPYYSIVAAGINAKDAVDWLENLSESNLSKEIKRRKESLLHEKEKAVSLKENLSLGGRIAMCEELLTFIKRNQGEQNPVNYTDEDIVEAVKDASILDMIEPEFHEGEWIVNKFGDVWHIDSFDKKNYQVSDGKGNYNYFPVLKQDEMHLWTIKDAKPGDVLVDVYGNIGIFEKRYGINWHTYCYLGHEGRFISEGGSHGSICYPATKEQSTRLFKKMKESCYEWDDEKKELKQIESKFHEGDWIIRSAEGFKHNTYLIKEIKDYYVCEELKGRRVTFTFNDVHKNFKLWDISDANPGDVLADKYNNIGIFQECKGICWHSYIYLGCDGELRGFNIGGSHEQTGTHPATKEQREQLEKAMADAGYEWDAEKKESCNGMFNNPDYKQFLMDYFKIKL